MPSSIAELFDLAIGLEQRIQAIYSYWQVSFAASSQSVAFWQGYAREEDYHAKLLLTLQGQLTAEQLAEPANETVFDSALHTRDLVNGVNPEIETLNEALEIATRIENSEVNSILEFLVIHFSSKESTKAMVQSQLREHVQKLNVLSPAIIFGENYKSIKAVN